MLRFRSRPDTRPVKRPRARRLCIEPMSQEKTTSDITFGDCLDSVRYEIEDALARFPQNRDLFLHQVRLLVDSLGGSGHAENGTQNP